MAGMSEVLILLDRHKSNIVRELDSSNILGVLVKKGVFTVDEEELVSCEKNASTKGDVFIELLAHKGAHAFREFCYALESECPHVLTDLLADSSVPSTGRQEDEQSQVESDDIESEESEGARKESDSETFCRR